MLDATLIWSLENWKEGNLDWSTPLQNCQFWICHSLFWQLILSPCHGQNLTTSLLGNLLLRASLNLFLVWLHYICICSHPYLHVFFSQWNLPSFQLPTPPQELGPFCWCVGPSTRLGRDHVTLWCTWTWSTERSSQSTSKGGGGTGGFEWKGWNLEGFKWWGMMTEVDDCGNDWRCFWVWSYKWWFVTHAAHVESPETTMKSCEDMYDMNKYICIYFHIHWYIKYSSQGLSACPTGMQKFKLRRRGTVSNQESAHAELAGEH